MWQFLLGPFSVIIRRMHVVAGCSLPLADDSPVQMKMQSTASNDDRGFWGRTGSLNLQAQPDRWDFTSLIHLVKLQSNELSVCLSIQLQISFL